MEKVKDELIEKELKKNEVEAAEIIQDVDKTKDFLLKLEEKLKDIPLVGDALSNVPTLISLVRDYVNKEYPDPPVGTIVAIVAALLYLLAPVDLIPDVIPGIGYLDDAAVIAFCLKQVGDDVVAYKEWRNL